MVANWYGISGIDFHFRGTNTDPEITFDGITDSICVDVEQLMWGYYREDHPDEPDEFFDQYMLDNAEEVKDRIRDFRG